MNQSPWKLFSPDTQVLVQGLTGKEGLRMSSWLKKSGVHVVAGVTPGKAGQVVDGSPIFDSVSDAVRAFPNIGVSCIVVPAGRLKGAAEEALRAGLKYIHILTESVPVHDVRAIRALAQEQHTWVIGPSSVGYLQFPMFRLGYIGGEDPFALLREGDIGLVSTSGGMTNELMMAFARRQIGVKVAMSVGGDRIPCLSLEDALAQVDQVPGVERLVIFAEPGRALLTKLVQTGSSYAHPLVILLAGDVLDDLPKGKAYGHTGTLLHEEALSVRETRVALNQRGITCVGTLPELLDILRT